MLVPRSSIIIPPNRIRQEFDEEEISELALSIASKGLMHPIVVRENPESKGSFHSFLLVAGERRLRALEMLGDEEIPVTLMRDLDPIAYREAELEENVKRKDLTWQEEAAAIKALHDLRREQDPSWTMKKTSEEIIGHKLEGRATTVSIREGLTTNDMLTLAAHLDKPGVANSKTAKDAIKILRKDAEAWLSSQLAADYKGTEIDFHNCNFADLKVEPVDCIIVDPPYGLGADEFGTQAVVAHTYDDSEDKFAETLRSLRDYSHVWAKDQAHLYIFCSHERWWFIGDMFTGTDWRVWPRPIIWDKGAGMLPEPDFGPRYTYECILFANRGRRPVLGVYPDVIHCAGQVLQGRIHAAQKPVEVYRNLLGRSCAPGDRVLDPCAGSGTIFLAAKLLSLHATGCEADKTIFDLALARLETEL